MHSTGQGDIQLKSHCEMSSDRLARVTRKVKGTGAPESMPLALGTRARLTICSDPSDPAEVVSAAD